MPRRELHLLMTRRRARRALEEIERLGYELAQARDRYERNAAILRAAL